ncbi:MAG: cytochrome c [Deltaproteobacteria bacterium]|nr:cytochrome c [Deltaproteobacteria bacterium]
MRRFILFCGWVLLSACGVPPNSESGFPGVEGARLFKAKGCVTCHTIGEGVKVGPDLRGLFARRDEAWVRRYISDPGAMFESDPTAKALKEKYKVAMPKMMISASEMDQLIAYLQKATAASNP